MDACLCSRGLTKTGEESGFPLKNFGNDKVVIYVVGNSTFYNVLVPVEQVYAEMLSQLGFSNVECVPLRKRNSKKELIEFDVRARWR